MSEKRKFTINKDTCKGCRLCLAVCPYGCLEMSKEVNKKGMHYAIMKHPEKCTGCGLCVAMCPDCGIEIVYHES